MKKPIANLPFHNIARIDFPIEVQIQTQTICNARCIMCPYVEIHETINHGRMPESSFQRLIDECSQHQVERLKTFLMNEPLQDERLPRLIKYAKGKLPQAIVGFGTNGSLLKGKLASELLDSGVDEICFNFPSISKEIHEQIMIRVPFEQTLENILSFAAKVKSGNLPIKLLVNIVEVAAVLPEISAAVKFWTDRGFIVLQTPLNNRGGNIADEGIRALPPPHGRRICDRPFYKIYICHNGDVILCSADWHRRFILGNALESSIHEVWHGRKQARIRSSLLAGGSSLPDICQLCDYPALYDSAKT